MERTSTTDYTTGLPSPLGSNPGDHNLKTESLLPEHSTTTHHPQTYAEVRHPTYSTTATPTSEYSGYPPSARSGSFPDPHMHQRYHQPAAGMSGSSMAQANSPSQSLPDGRAHQAPQIDTAQMKSDPDVPIDPSISGASPTNYAYPHSPYGTVPAQDMNAHNYAHPGGYAQTRPDWSGYGGQAAPITPNHHVFPQTPTTASQNRPTQVFNFVPIPGAQQHKRPRRRYEEIERMYKCGWNGCEKAYGTLNHLNAHVTMQSHGNKRVPEEFKEIRKEWKARKKAEEADRKARDEEAARVAQAAQAAQNGNTDNHSHSHESSAQTPSVSSYTASGRLPPIGYSPSQYPPPVSMGQEYSNNYIAAGSYSSTSPYAQSHQHVYGQANGGSAQ